MNRIKRIIFSFTLLNITLCFYTYAEAPLTGNAVNSFSVIELRKITPVDTYFTGKVEATESNTIAFGPIGDPSRISFIKKPGGFQDGPVFIKDGTIQREGTVVAELEADKQKADLKKAEYAYKSAFEEVQRNDELIRTNSVSKKEYDDSMIALMTARSNLDKAKYQLSCTKITAPYSGVMMEVLKGQGMAAGSDAEIARVARMDPILVKVPLTNELVALVTKDDPVYVYPSDSKEHVIGWAETNPTVRNTLFIFLHNEITPLNPEEEEYRKLPKAYLLFPIMNFYEHSFVAKLGISVAGNTDDLDTLGIPDEAINTDSQGDYVFKACGQTAFKAKGSTEVFTAEKIYIKTGGLKRSFNTGLYSTFTFVSLKDPGSLKLYDIILIYYDDKVKSGSKVAYTKAEWMFFPGEEVMVTIPALTPPGFYVPKTAVIHETEWSNFVYVYDNGKARLAKVDIAGMVDDYFAIKNTADDGPVKDGAKVIILNSPEDASRLYDGMPVTIKDELPPDERLQHPHADPLRHISDNMKFFN